MVYVNHPFVLFAVENSTMTSGNEPEYLGLPPGPSEPYAKAIHSTTTGWAKGKR